MDRDLLNDLKRRGITVDQYRKGLNMMYRRNRAFKEYKRSHRRMVRNQNRALKQMFKK